MKQQDFSEHRFQFAIVVSKFNSFVTERLLEEAKIALRTNGVGENDIFTFEVPGCFEVPQMARKIAEMRNHDAIICLGALIRGKTLHFELISQECARGIQQVSADFGIPVTFGIITAETPEQAIERSGSKEENRGWEAAVAALQMAVTFRSLKESASGTAIRTPIH
jgi:6,7-dimethyl-8-ribityllumazine synthase